MQLFDGHGGKDAAKICTENLFQNLVTAHKAASCNAQVALDANQSDARSSLKAKIMDRNAWMGYMMDSAIESSFHVTDIQVKKTVDSGTTASVLLIRE